MKIIIGFSCRFFKRNEGGGAGGGSGGAGILLGLGTLELSGASG
tara:strand:- start:291 stop:422 length:132 start_codon:yes stop_codon:yes gene_type:complete